MKDDTISRQAAIEAMRKAKDKSEAHRMLMQLPSAQLDVPDTNVGDMISRQAAISEIMEDIKDRSLHDDPATPEDYAEGYDEGIRNAAAIVLQMPSAQPEIIRCKDCKFFSHGYCRFHDAKFVRPDGYCYWGEQKEGEQHGTK